MCVFKSEKMIIILRNVQDVKENQQKFQLLSKMYLFMIDKHPISFIFRIFNENKRIERNAIYFCIFEKDLAHNYHITNIKVLI